MDCLQRQVGADTGFEVMLTTLRPLLPQTAQTRERIHMCVLRQSTHIYEALVQTCCFSFTEVELVCGQSRRDGMLQRCDASDFGNYGCTMAQRIFDRQWPTLCLRKRMAWRPTTLTSTTTTRQRGRRRGERNRRQPRGGPP